MRIAAATLIVATTTINGVLLASKATLANAVITNATNCVTEMSQDTKGAMVVSMAIDDATTMEAGHMMANVHAMVSEAADDNAAEEADAIDDIAESDFSSKRVSVADDAGQASVEFTKFGHGQESRSNCPPD